MNTAEFLPGSEAVLDSIVSILNRYPCNEIMISAHTSGFGTQHFQQSLSENRASQVAAYLWGHGVTDRQTMEGVKFVKGRTQMYVGYGDYLPIANDLHNESLRSNSRLQIIASPSYKNLHWDKYRKHYKLFSNIGSVKSTESVSGVDPNASYKETFYRDTMPEDDKSVAATTDYNKLFPPEKSSYRYRKGTYAEENGVSFSRHKRVMSSSQTRDDVMP